MVFSSEKQQDRLYLEQWIAVRTRYDQAVSSASIDPANRVCTLIEGFLFPAECEALIARLEAAGIGATAALYPPSYRNNDRLVLDDPELAAALYTRLAAHAPAELVDDGGATWRRERLNPRFRCCRYRDGQCFTIHRDGVYHASPDEHSRLTFMIYLNDGSEFQGGATRYYHDRSGAQLLRSVTPRRGACILFDHALWHDGEAVQRGTKYVLRSDLIYRRQKVTSEQKITKDEKVTSAHLGYIWTARLLSNNTLASAGRDQTLRLHRVDAATHSLREQQVLLGHDSSIGGIAEARGFLCSGDRQGHIRRWRLDGERYVFDSGFAAHQGAVLCLLRVVHPRLGECLASAGADGVIRLYTDSAQAQLELGGHRGWIWSLAADAGALWSGGEDGTVRRHELGSATTTASAVFDRPVHSLLLTGDSLYCGLDDGRLIALEKERLQPRFTRRPHKGSLRCMLALRDGRIATGGEDDSVALWTADLGTELHRATHGDFVRALVELDSGELLSGSYDGTLRFFSPACAPPESKTSQPATRPDPTPS
jgi:WD40 repeat protein